MIMMIVEHWYARGWCVVNHWLDILSLLHSAWSESMTWLMTSSRYRGHPVLSHLMFWGSDIDFDEVTKRSNVYRLWGYIYRYGGFCTIANSAFGRYCQASSNAVRDTNLLRTVAEKIEFFEKKLNLSKPEVGVARWRHHFVGVQEYSNRWKFGDPRPFHLGAIRVLRFCQMAHRRSENGNQRAIQPKPEVEFRRRPAYLTQRPQFPIRVPIRY